MEQYSSKTLWNLNNLIHCEKGIYHQNTPFKKIVFLFSNNLNCSRKSLGKGRVFILVCWREESNLHYRHDGLNFHKHGENLQNVGDNSFFHASVHTFIQMEDYSPKIM